MKSISSKLVLVAATLLMGALPVLAVENGMGAMEPKVQKNECLLVAKNCASDTLQDRIEKIKIEIGKGTSVYTNDELRTLNRQLENAQKSLEYENIHGGA